MATHATEHVPAARSRRARLGEWTKTGPRLQATAGRAILVGVLALAFGTLLNAESIRRTAEIQPEGWKRDVGMALTRPLIEVSSTLRLDVPRDELRDALGRADQSSNGPVVFVHRTKKRPARATPFAKPEHRGGAKPKPPAKPAFSPDHPLRIWVAGDSLAITPGWQLVRTGDRTHVIDAVGRKVDGQVASGLERPDVFDWFGHIRKEVSDLRPNAVVVTFGANDDHDLMTGVPAGRDVGPFGSPSWKAEYRRRVGGVMDDVTSRGALLVWIGLPIARDAGLSGRFRVMNRIYRSEARKRAPQVAFVDTYSLFQDKDGHFSEYLPRDDGKLVKMRTGDGVHFEDEGGQLIAWHVLRELNRVFDLHSWKRKQHP